MVTIEYGEKTELWCDEHGNWGVWLKMIDKHLRFGKHESQARSAHWILERSHTWIYPASKNVHQLYWSDSGHKTDYELWFYIKRFDLSMFLKERDTKMLRDVMKFAED